MNITRRRGVLACMIGAVAAVLAAVVGACAAGGGRGDRFGGSEAGFTFVLLKTGPTSAEKSATERQEIFRGHMANMKRLADDGELIIAGPFNAPADRSWRGLFVMDEEDPAKALEIAATDPGVVSGVFVLEARPMRSSAGLRESLSLEKALQARVAATPAGQAAPRALRPYVIVTTSDASAARAAIAYLGVPVVWWGEFADEAGGGVFVLDAEKAEDVRARGGEAFPGVIDGWFSTSALEGLPTREPTAIR